MPMLLLYLPLIIMTGLIEAALTADDSAAANPAPDPHDQMMNATVIHFPNYGRAD